MAVAVKSAQRQHKKQHRTAKLDSKISQSNVHQSNVRQSNLRKGREGAPQSLTVVESLRRHEPQWLPAAVLLRKISTPLALGSLVMILVLSGLNVLLEREWGQKYAQLETAKRRQGALVTQTERQKYQLPRELEQSPQDFVPQTQNNTLFLQPEAPTPVSQKSASPRRTIFSPDRLPIGY